MSDYTGIALIVTAITGGLSAVLAGVAAIYTIWSKNDQAKRDAEKAERDAALLLRMEEIKSKQGEQAGDIRKIEVNTNSLTTKLNEATRAGALSEGMAQGRADQKAESRQEVQDAKLEAYQLGDQRAPVTEGDKSNEGKVAGQISVDSAEITVESAEITVDKPKSK